MLVLLGGGALTTAAVSLRVRTQPPA